MSRGNDEPTGSVAVSSAAPAAAAEPGDVYQHLGNIVDRVISEKPQDAYGLFEVLSRLIKAGSVSRAESDTEAAALAEASASEALAEYGKLLRKLDEVPAEEGTPIALCAVPDFNEDADLLSWAGVGFGEQESYKVMCSLRGLAAKETGEAGLTKLRFWGKIFGAKADYYVAEAQRPEGTVDPEAEDAAETEEPGKGVNKYAYYVTTDVCLPWRRLPDLKPKDIEASRRVKKIVTGELSAKVITHPSFTGKEDVLLRAQIARITADTVLCPKGFLKRDPEGEPDAEPEESEEFACPLPAEMLKQESWTHMVSHILRSGRTTHMEPPEEEEGNDEVNEKRRKGLAEIENDPARDIIRGLGSDGLAWVIKQAGDTALYESAYPPIAGEGAPPVPPPPSCNAVTFVRSLTWPGAVTALRGNRFVNFYVGYGLPSGEPDFFFPAPLDIQDEPEEAEEQAEPQGKVEEEVVQEEEA